MNLIVNFFVWDIEKEDFVLVELSSECPEREFSGGGLTDEGYSYWGETYTLQDDRVYRYSCVRSCDCDGPLTQYSEDSCGIENLYKRTCEWEGVEYIIPQWEEDKSFQEDAYAQSMNY